MRQKNWLGAQGQCPLVKLSCHGQGKEVAAAWLVALPSFCVKAQLALQSVVIKEPGCIPSASCFWATPLGVPQGVLPWESHSNLEKSLCLRRATTPGLMLRSGPCSAIQCRWVFVPLGFLHVAHQSEDKPECKSGALNQTVSPEAGQP